MTMRTKSPATVDEYLAQVAPVAARESLSSLRAIIREEVPEAEEVISYGVPTYKLRGMICSFGAFKNHCSFFPGGVVEEFAEELKEYKTSKGTIQFAHDRPLPENLVRTILRSRVAANLSKKK